MSSSWESTSHGKCEKKIEIYNVDFKLKAPKVTNINLLPY